MTRSQISALVASYLANNGTVTICPTMFAVRSTQVSRETLRKVREFNADLDAVSERRAHEEAEARFLAQA